ncbi:MAG: hypothetical protein EU544_06650 [Promethearchaeota archaeon]|nr:MAG: hypothetical protein EU544_06650 [Candidatus Lokiarchaeota archaeon]
MSGRKISERTVSIPEVKRLMEDVKEKIMQIDEEEGMSHFQDITYKYVNKFAKMADKAALTIQKHLQDKYNIEELYAINIVNIDPKTLHELRVILEKSFSGKTLSEDQLQEILYEIEELKTS